MGLTIHWDLKLKAGNKDFNKVRNIVSLIRQKALDLPFETVSEIIEISKKKELDFEYWRDKNQSMLWTVLSAGQYIDDPTKHGTSYNLNPSRLIAINIWPGEGCETVDIGFATYPKKIYPKGHIKGIETNRNKGWSWHSFCKTQYATQTSIQHFLKCHCTVIKLLDFVKTIPDVTIEVSDEGKFWENRDMKALAEEVGEWNNMIAAFAGKLKDTIEGSDVNFVAPILDYKDFEHLEAKGQEKLSTSPVKIGVPTCKNRYTCFFCEKNKG